MMSKGLSKRIIVSCDEMRKIEKEAFTKFFLSETQIIENVGIQGARIFLKYCPKDVEEVIILMGKGNNAADALVCARHLFYKKKIFILPVFGVESQKMQFSPELKKQWDILKALDAQVISFNELRKLKEKKDSKKFALIDGLYGIGFQYPLKNEYFEKDIISYFNKSPLCSFVLSFDIPSGVEADTGRGDFSLKAHVTLGIACPKWGHYLKEGVKQRGKLIIIEGGFPEVLFKRKSSAYLANSKIKISLKRDPYAHKNDFGHLLVVGGSKGLSGAPLLCAEAAQSVGVGLLTLLTMKESYEEICWRSHKNLSLMIKDDLRGGSLDPYSAIVLGPGLSTSQEAESLLRKILNEYQGPLVLDADALNILAKNSKLLSPKNRKASLLVLTPHVGEMARILNMTSCKNELFSLEGIRKVKEFARRNECFVLLKNAISFLYTPDGNLFVLDAPNSGLAKGGSGDVLSGMIGGFIAQRPKAESFLENCLKGMLFHSQKGKEQKMKKGEYLMQAQDLYTK